MADDVLPKEAASIQRCVARAREELFRGQGIADR